MRANLVLVSPTSIRSRILKVPRQRKRSPTSGVSPTSIRSRILKDSGQAEILLLPGSFTHVDPFEDTERLLCSLLII